MVTTSLDLGHPLQGDVIDLILADHVRMEALLRLMRRNDADRDAARAAFAVLHSAHAVAEEELVYPVLQRRDAITEHEAEHGQEEHAEAHEALLAVLEVKGTNTQKYEDALEELSAAVNHHLVEEEQTILNPARKEVAERTRAENGAAFARRRNQLVAQGFGSLDDVRALVRKAEKKGLLDDE